MASTYVNDLRLNEMATGDASGTWGTVTNTNLELIGEALGYGTEGITTNANTHTTTVADGATDPGRAMYIEYTGTLDSACTITIAPNTLSRMHFIENGTSGSQNIIIKQGSGATITIPPGDTKAVYLDGAGSGAAVVDAFASLSVVDLKVQDDLTVTDDATIGGTLGVTGIVTLTDDLIIGDGKTIGSASDVDAITIAANGQLTLTQTLIGTALDISGDIDVDGTSNLDVVDIDGALTQDGGAVFNEDSADVDFRVESNGNANILFVDGGNNTVGINDTTPAALFTVKANANTYAGGFRIEGTDETTALGIVHVNGDNFFSGNATDDHLTLTSGGNLGLGVASPEGKFEIEDGGTSKDILQKITLDDDNLYGLVIGNDSFSTTLADGFAVTVGNAGVVGLQARGTSSQLQFRTANHERGRITTTGTLVLGATTSTSTANTFDARDGDGVTAAIVGNNALYVQRGQDTTAGANFIIQANRGSLNSPANSNNGDNCGQILFRAYHTNGHYTSSIIRGIQDGPNGTNDMPGTLQFLTSADGSATPDERMRISTTGQIMFGATSSLAASVLFGFNKSADAFLRTQNNSTGATNPFAIFHANGTGVIGSINCTNSATVYNTSSDYRLKENVRPIENGLDRLNNLNPVKFEWKEDGTSSEGFIAHEAQEVFSDAITGKKDGEEMQGMDYGRITPLLVKAIQEQQEQIEQLKTEIEKLH